MLPAFLNRQYELLGSLSSSERSSVWHVRERATGVARAIKVSPEEWLPNPDAMALLQLRKGGINLATPLEVGLADGSGFQILEYFAGGDFATWMSANGASLAVLNREQLVHTIVADLVPVLAMLAARPSDPRHLVHGDIKPSNLLVLGPPLAGGHAVLGDFDALQIFDPSRSIRRRTLRYAAPEGFSLTSDYWSLGIMLFEIVAGVHPFAEMSEQATRRLVQSIWKPNLSAIDNDAIRALLAGLIERNHETRWRAEDLERWLTGDPDIIREGLARCSETRASIPFVVAGVPCYTARDLAREMLRTWNTSTLSNIALEHWITGQLNRPEIAAYRTNLLARVDLSDDRKLLEFCFDLNPTAPPTWRHRPISRLMLDTAAAYVSRRAAGGPAEVSLGQASLEWIESVLSPDCQEFYRERLPRISDMLERLERAVEQHAGAWDVAIQAGAPEQARPVRDDLVADVIRAMCSIPMRREIEAFRNQLADVPFLVLLEDWTRCFGGDLRQLTIPQILVFQRLGPLARIGNNGVIIESYVGTDRQRRAMRSMDPIIWPTTQRKLLRELVPLPGAEIVELEAGDTFHTSQLPPFSVAVMQDLRNFRDWVSRVMRRVARTPPNLGTTNRPSMSVRMIRVENPIVAGLNGDHSGVELFMAMIRWDAAGCPAPYLSIRRGGLSIQGMRLLTPRLTERGSYVILLTGLCNIRLEHGRAPMHFWGGTPLSLSGITRPLVVSLRCELPKLVKVTDKIVASGVFRFKVPSLTKVLGKILQVNDEVFNQSKPGFWQSRLAEAIENGERLMRIRNNLRAHATARQQSNAVAKAL